MKTASAIFAIAVLAASPAFADHDSHSRRDTLWEKCVGEYVEAYPGQCLEILHKGIAKQREVLNYLNRDPVEDEYRRRECWSNPRITNPVRCSNGFPPVYSD
jgi:hypothetical protein